MPVVQHHHETMNILGYFFIYSLGTINLFIEVQIFKGPKIWRRVT